MTKLFLCLNILFLVTPIIIDSITTSTKDQLIIEEDNSNAYEQVETHFVKYPRDKLVQFYTTMSSYGQNVANAKGIHKIASEFEILVFGPAKVGKSTLIQKISGNPKIETSARLDACTSEVEKYTDDYGIRCWDTPGFERWNIEDAENFLKENFYDRQIVPKVAIFCRTANSLGSTEVIQYMFDEFQKHGILFLFVITKWPFIPKSEQDSIVQEGISLFGGQSKPIYGKASQGYKAYECQPKKSYIIPVNSKEDEILGIRVGVANINTLRKILISKLDKESQGKLVQLYKDNLHFWEKLGYGAIEILDDIGVEASEVVLTKEEQTIYEKMKNGNNRIKATIAALEKLVDKYFKAWDEL